jgi:hypothetical protein
VEKHKATGCTPTLSIGVKFSQDRCGFLFGNLQKYTPENGANQK